MAVAVDNPYVQVVPRQVYVVMLVLLTWLVVLKKHFAQFAVFAQLSHL